MKQGRHRQAQTNAEKSFSKIAITMSFLTQYVSSVLEGSLIIYIFVKTVKFT